MNKQLMILALVGLGFYLYTKGQQINTTPGGVLDGSRTDCLTWQEAVGYWAARWIATGRPIGSMPSLGDLIPERGSGGICITRAYLDQILDNQ